MNRESAANEHSNSLEAPEETAEPREGEVIEAEDKAASDLARPGELLPPILNVLPVSERPLFPGQMMPLMMREDPWLETIEKVGETSHKMVARLLKRR